MTTTKENREQFCRYGTVLYQIELDRVSSALEITAEAQELRPLDGKSMYQCLERCFARCPNLVDTMRMREAPRYEDLKFGWRQYIADVRAARVEAQERAALFSRLTEGF